MRLIQAGIATLASAASVLTDHALPPSEVSSEVQNPMPSNDGHYPTQDYFLRPKSFLELIARSIREITRQDPLGLIPNR